MMFLSSWRSLVKVAIENSTLSRRGRKGRARLRPSYRPLLEQFEDRLVPTVLSIPSGLSVTAGQPVMVPVNIDNPNPSTSGGLTAVSLAIDYDPTVFTVAATDVALGTVNYPIGWSAPAVSLGTGEIGITCSGPAVTSTASGSLVEITFHAIYNDAAGSSTISMESSNSQGTTVLGCFNTGFNGGTGTLLLTPNPGISNSVQVSARTLIVTNFTPTPNGFVIDFNESVNTSSVNMYSPLVPGQAGSADDIMLATTGSQVSVRGSVLWGTNPLSVPASSPNSEMTFVKTEVASAVGTFNPGGGLLSAGMYTVTLRSYSASTGNGFADLLGGALDGQDSYGQDRLGTSNYVHTFPVSAPPVAVGIPDFARSFSNTDLLFLPASIGNGNPFDLSYPAGSANDDPSVPFSTTAVTLQGNIQTALNTLVGFGGGGVPNAVAVVQNTAIATQGAFVKVTFQNSLVTATTQLLGSTTAGVTISLANIDVPNNISNNGIPIALSNGQNVNSDTFTLDYNPNLLYINSVVPSTAISNIAGYSFTPTIDNTSGTVAVSWTTPTKISSTTASLTIARLLATVPPAATSYYGEKQLLHFVTNSQSPGSESLGTTGGPIAVTTQDGVEVAAFFGDVNDTGLPFPSNGAVGAISIVAGLVPNVVFQTLPGFATFPNLDPVIIGAVAQTGQAGIVPSDATAMNKQLTSGQPAIPWLPAGLTVTGYVGPDPTLSVGDLAPRESPGANYPGETVIVPVNIDTARPEGSTGMVEAVLALTYDPKVFDVSAADVQLGTVPEGGNGWTVQAEVNAQTGLIGVELYSSTPIQSTGGGSLVTITMHVRETAPSGTTALALVPYVDPAGGAGVYATSLLGAEGEFTLHPAQTPAGTEPGAPGQITIGNRQSAVGNGDTGGESPPPVAPAFALSGSAPNGSALPLAVVEQVFGDQEQARQLVQNSAFTQPGVILTSASNEQAANGVRDLAWLQTPAGLPPAEWLPDDPMAYLGQTARRGLPALLQVPADAAQPDWLSDDDLVDLAGSYCLR